MCKWTLISFYTPLYEESSKRLEASCKRFSLPYLIEPLPSKSTWEANCCMKPVFILKKLQELKSPVLWVDADAEIVRQLPEQFPYELSMLRDLDVPPEHREHVGSGVVYINYTPKNLKLVQKWIDLCDDKEWDQVALKEALKDEDIRALPREYGMIYDRISKKDDPIIVHYQASRLTKKILNRELAPFFSPR